MCLNWTGCNDKKTYIIVVIVSHKFDEFDKCRKTAYALRVLSKIHHRYSNIKQSVEMSYM